MVIVALARSVVSLVRLVVGAAIVLSMGTAYFAYVDLGGFLIGFVLFLLVEQFIPFFAVVFVGAMWMAFGLAWFFNGLEYVSSLQYSWVRVPPIGIIQWWYRCEYGEPLFESERRRM